MTARRIACIWLPHLAIESWQRRAVRRGEPWSEDVPLALSAPGPHGPVIHAVNRAAGLAGARVGGRVTDIRAICPELRIMDAEPAQDAALLAQGDCVLAMYHDQGLIPVKYLGLDQGVNVTLGLPFVRTSPDHGTAFDLAGTGRADPSSLAAAANMARALVAGRKA